MIWIWNAPNCIPGGNCEAIAMKKKLVLVLLIFAATGLFLAGSLFRSVSERSVEHYLSNLSADGLTKISIYGLGESVELYTAEEQEEILNHLDKFQATLGGDDSDTQAAGGIIFDIKLFYADGREELVTLPAFRYPTLLGDRDFYLSIDGEKVEGAKKLYVPFRKYFRLLQD